MPHRSRLIPILIFLFVVPTGFACSSEKSETGTDIDTNTEVDTDTDIDTDTDADTDTATDVDTDNDIDTDTDTDTDTNTVEDGGTDTDADTDTDIDTIVINPSIHNTILGRPTDSSIAVSILSDSVGDEASVDYSTELSTDNTELAGDIASTGAVASAGGEPIVIELTGLAANTKYYYRVQYRAAGGSESPDNLHSFHTQRAKGSAFSFGVQGDTHPERYNDKMFHGELLTLTMNDVRDRQPDFYFMMGDDFSIEKIIQNFKEDNFEEGHVFQKFVEGALSYADYLSTIDEPFVESMIADGIAAPQGNAGYLSMRQDFLGIMANATALLLVNGNHEQAHAANLGGIFNNAAVWAADGRLKYYPLPAPDGFYTGDETAMDSINGYPTIGASDRLLRDYYAFTWGDALFVAIDPYWHSPEVSPNGTLYDGDTDVDKWTATMGDEQYAWLKETLQNSDATWKFVFAHHINGGGRGGAGSVTDQEWGGKLADFEDNRPTWDKPVHQVLVDGGVTAFFQGHDHTFGREIIDGVVYQSLPNPADNSYFAYNCTAYDPESIAWQGPSGYGVYDPDYGVVMPNSGYLHVTVSPDVVRIDYVRTYRSIDLETDPNGIFSGTEMNGEVAFSYSIPAQPGDDQASDFAYTCIGDEPPSDWIYND